MKEKIVITRDTVKKIMDRYQYPEETRQIIEKENLLPQGLLSRLHSVYPQHSGILEDTPFMFTGKDYYAGLKGFREIVGILEKNGIQIGHIQERELFVEVYRFMATKHVLNSINWKSFAKDSMFQLVFPQPNMIRKEIVDAYINAKTDEERQAIVKNYIKHTNPHDGKQLLNKPWFKNSDGQVELIHGSQHKYPPCQLIFDKTTQNCFAFCTYCFRHAQVRGDEDMFIQRDVRQIHEYLKQHKEVTDILITGGDAGYITPERFEEYINPIIEEPELMHIKTVRLGSRALSYKPEMVLTREYDAMLALFDRLYDNGIQIFWNSHFSTPREILNPSTIAAIRRLRHHNVLLKSQSPIMNHISLFTDENGKVDVDRSAQNWIDLANILAMLNVGFHSMYCARSTGEHHYFTAPLADIDKIFSKIYKVLPSINRPTRYITQTSSAGKISLMGTAEINGEKVFVLKFNEGRNMDWMDRVYFAKYDEKETVIERLKPWGSDKFFYEDELHAIEQNLHNQIQGFINQNKVADYNLEECLYHEEEDQ